MVDIIKKYERTLTTIPKALAAKKLLCRACKRVVLVPAMEFHMNTMLRETKICNQCTHNKVRHFIDNNMHNMLNNFRFQVPTEWFYPLPTHIASHPARRAASRRIGLVRLYRARVRYSAPDRGDLVGSFGVEQCHRAHRTQVKLTNLSWVISKQFFVPSNCRLPRWHRGDDWSPWNCVCLTEEEANAHKMLTHFEELYDESMMQRVAVRHEQARLMFAQMNRLNRDFVESMEWWRVGIKEAAV